MRPDCHDAVSAHLMIPVSPMPAARGASQPAVAAASAQQALAPAHAAEDGRPAAGETMISKQVVINLGILQNFENLVNFSGRFGPRGGWKRILLEKSLPKVGSRLESVPWGPVSWPFSVFAKFATSITT